MSPEMFATRFKEAREKKNITIKALQPLVGASPSAMNGYATGKNLPPLDVASKIAQELEVSLDWLCGIEAKNQDISIHTNSDVLKMLAELVITHTVSGMKKKGVIFGAHIDSDNNKITIEEKRIPGIIDFKTWQNLADLVQKGVVGADVYRAWIEKTSATFDSAPFPFAKAWVRYDECDILPDDALPF